MICSDDDPPTSNNGAASKSSTASSSTKTKSSFSSKLKEKQDSAASAHQASKFISFFHISDFIAILSGYKVVFVDPYERFATDERSHVAIFDLEHDTQDIEQFEDQFKPLEKIFNVPLLKNRYFNGTIIRLPLRMQTNTCSVSNKLVHVKDILMNAKDFMKEAHLHILFSKNISNIQFCRTKDSQNIEKIYSINVDESCLEQFRLKYKKISDAIADGEFPRTSTIIITLRKQIETKVEKTEWILSIFADTMRLLNSNYFLMKLAIPISDNCEKDIRFSHKSNLISSDTGFIKTFYLTKPIICYIEDKEGILMSHFCRLNISDSLKLSHFNEAYALMLKDLTKITRKEPDLLWSLMPDLDKSTEFTDLLAEIWQEIAKHELFFSVTEGWGFVAIEDMIINDVENQSVLQEILTKIYSETNYPVVIMPQHVLKALQKYCQKDSLQIMSPSQTSDILHKNGSLIEQLKPNQKIELLRYLIKEPATTNTQSVVANSAWPAFAARYILDLPLLLLANQKFIRFQSPNKVKSVYLIEKEYVSLFGSESMHTSQFINPELPKDILQIFKKFDFQRLTQLQMVSDSELSELINVPKEWKNGDEKIYWPKTHEKYNIDWLEMLWKYLCEYCQNDLTMMENFNIIFTTQAQKQLKSAKKESSIEPKNIILFKLSKNSSLVYTPVFNELVSDASSTTTTNAAINNNESSKQQQNDSSNSCISEETYAALNKILNKLGFQCIESISPSVLAHPSFLNYVPNLRGNRYNLLRAFRNKYKHVSSIKIIQDFNALLNEADIKTLQVYLSKLEALSSSTQQLNSTSSSSSTQTKEADEEKYLLEILKELPIFENSAIECSNKFISLKEASLIYDTPIRLPFELPGIKPFIYVSENESKLLILEKLHLNLVKDFSIVIKEIVKYCTSKEFNSLSSDKIHLIGKWILLHCASFLLNKSSDGLKGLSSDFVEHFSSAKIFLNQNHELCSASQFINPLFKEKFLEIFDPKCIPAKDLIAEEKCINNLKEFKMRNCLQLKVDEIIDLYEHSIKQNDQYRRLFAELIIDILLNRLQDSSSSNQDSIEKILSEYSTTKAVNLKHFLMSVNWIPLKRERAQSYPQSLFWKGAESSFSSSAQNSNLPTSSTTQPAENIKTKFSSPRDCVDSQYAYCAGSVAYISDLDIPNELKTYVDLKQVHLDVVVRHLKLTTKCFESSALKVEWYDYLTVAKKCYEFMSSYEPQEIFRELKANDLNEWIWNGAGFSSLSSIFTITDKDHPLCSHVAILPFELYVFVKFFERLGMSKLPDAKQLEQILTKCIKNSQKLINTNGSAQAKSNAQTQLILENAAKNYPLINWIKTNYPNEKQLAAIIKDYEDNLKNISPSSLLHPFLSNSSAKSSSPDKPSSPTHEVKAHTFENSSECIYLYLPELYKGIEIKDNLINSVMTLVKNRQIKILDEEAYLMRKVAVASNQSKNQTNNIYDHYKVYNEIILPNLNSLSKNVKDSVVLFALDHSDPKMLEILRDHPCIPVSPFGRRLKKPNKLIHPTGKIAPLYSESDERFPCGSKDTYIRDDRLHILKILGMKCDHLSWQEIVERAESVSNIKEYDLAVERSIVILNVLNEMLNDNTSSLTSSPTQKTAESKDEKEAKSKIAELIRDISFIPVKSKPYQKLNLTWHGEKFKYSFAKPKELLSSSFESLCSTIWPVPLNEYKKKENIITKQVESFLGLDDLSSKFSLKDAFKQLEELSKLNLQEIDDSKEIKLVTDMCFQIYEYIQDECQKKPNECVQLVREFFADKKLILVNEEFVNANQLCWNLNANLKKVFYQMPPNFARSFKFLFTQVLSIKVNLDLPDLLHVVDSMKKKYKESPITNRVDFNILINVYSLIIDQGCQIITNLYLPNTYGILLQGRLLYLHPMNVDKLDKPEKYVHPAVDKRICIIAGASVNSQQSANSQNATSPTLSSANTASFLSSRVFPRDFGNKRLEGILARLDDDKIDIIYINNMDEGNPQIILDYLLEANRIHSLSAFLSEEDIFVILKYFNDFLARNYQAGTFQRLKELKIYKPLWSENYINLNFTASTNPANLAPQTGANVPNVYLISEEMAALMKRYFKTNPFVQKPTSPASSTDLIIFVRRNELAKLYSHLNLLNLNDLESFLHLCLPQFRKLDAKAQHNFLKYLYEEIFEKCFIHEKEKSFKLLRDKLYIQSVKGEPKLISDLYDMKSESLKCILSEAFFPDENFDSPQCMRFLKEAGLRTYLPSELCKKCMNEIEEKVSEQGWSDELRKRSKWLYQHLVENWEKFDDSVLQQRFLEPHCPDKRFVSIKEPFEYNEFNKTCLKLSDAELAKYESLIWSSSFMLPNFVTDDSLETIALEFLKINRKPCFALINQHLNNICEAYGSKGKFLSSDPSVESQLEDAFVQAVGKIYVYLDELSSTEHHKDIYKQLEDKEIVWSSSARRFISPNKICIQLEAQDEIVPFLFSLSPSMRPYKNLLIKLGAKDKPYAMLYGDILRKMAKVCGDDYLNSNELCKALKAMECFFKYLKQSSSGNKHENESNNENISSQYKLPGLYFVSTELKLEKSSSVVILDSREYLDYISKLPHDKFVFNPSEKVFKMNTNEIKPLIDKIFISQRPTLFSLKYESTYDFTLPDDPDSQRQNLLTSLERKYQQLFTSRQLHRSLARCISNEEARRTSPKHLPIDEVEKVIRERLSSIKVTCVEYLETSLSYRKLSQQQKIEQTVEEKACYLTHESQQFATLYVSKKHIEQPYFALCLARSLQPLLVDLHFDHSIFTSLISTSVSQMTRLLELVNVATEENILSVIKLQYVPSSGKLYGDDINLLAQFDKKFHNVLIGDLCIYASAEGSYIYCQIVKIESASKTSTFNQTAESENDVEYEFTVQIDENGAQLVKIQQKDLYVLENWNRIYDAVIAKPPDERESFKYQDSSAKRDRDESESANGKRSSADNAEDNFSSNASDSDKSETSSPYGSNEQIPNSIEIEQSKTEVNQELRLLWGLEENERKKKINRLLLKWHPDKNPGKEKYASEVFKHLKKQIELYKTDPFLAGFYKSSYSSYGSSTGGNSYGASGSSGSGSNGADEFKSRHYGSYEDLNRKGSPSGSTHSSPSRDGPGAPGSSAYDDYVRGASASNLGRAGSFRQEWERRRQQKRSGATGADPS